MRFEAGIASPEYVSKVLQSVLDGSAAGIISSSSMKATFLNLLDLSYGTSSVAGDGAPAESRAILLSDTTVDITTTERNPVADRMDTTAEDVLGANAVEENDDGDYRKLSVAMQR